ncbi:serine/threonine protein kinase [Thalassotalea crassostreae]|uniref:serine/threonine protein kinase n=3 Tax=Thalassotalea crassostreae TaxID=1763536 RepID=UPI0008A12CE7|nr:serine/threonine-protein kinase [Thalassotalea crassostreae]
MEQKSAFKILSVKEHANEQEIVNAYRDKKSDLDKKIANAATPALAKKFAMVLDKVEQAYLTLTSLTATASQNSIVTTDLKSAYKTFNLPESARLEDVTREYQQKKSSVLAKMEAAATPALQKKFAKVLDKIEQAYQVLNQQSSDNSKTLAQQMDNLDDLFGKGKSSQPEKSQPEPTKASVSKSSSVLSQTKLADLPGLSPSDVPQVELQPGQVIANRYEVKELIGQGGMGVVYRAFDKNRGEDIAIKLLLPSLTKNERALERFLNEARVSSMLSHPNIVNVFDVQTHQHDDGDTLYFLTMELLEGQDLRQVMDNQSTVGRPFDIDDVKEYIDAICIGLKNAHETTVHRDIKPENIWIGSDGKIKLMDFGIAQLQSSSQRTQTGAAMGTAYYMAPEQLKGLENIDGRADQYAVAVLAYELLTGEVPAGAIEPISEVRADIPAAMADAIMQALSPRAEKRFSDISAFNQAIQNGKGTSPKSKKRVQNKASSSSSHLQTKGPNKFAIVMFVLMFIGGLGYAGVNGHLDFLKPVDKELIASQKAEAGKLLGKIKVLRKRFDESIRQVKANYQQSQRDNVDTWYHESYHVLAVDGLENGQLIVDIEGEQSSGETLLKLAKSEKEMESALNTLSEVVDSWQSLNSEFENIDVILEYLPIIQEAHTKWEAHKNKYGLKNTPNSVTLGLSQYENATAKLDTAEYSEARTLYEQSYENYSQGISDSSPEVNQVKARWQQEEKERQKAKRKKEREKVIANRKSKAKDYLYDLNRSGRSQKIVRTDEGSRTTTRFNRNFTHKLDENGQCILEGWGETGYDYADKKITSVYDTWDERDGTARTWHWKTYRTTDYLVGYKMLLKEGRTVKLDYKSVRDSLRLIFDYDVYSYSVKKSDGKPKNYSVTKKIDFKTKDNFVETVPFQNYLKMCGMVVVK